MTNTNTNKEKFLKLVTPETTNTLGKIKWRNANRAWLRKSNDISFKERLIQYINKIINQIKTYWISH